MDAQTAARIARLEQALRGVPSRFAAGGPVVQTITESLGTDVLITISTIDWKGVAVPGTVPTTLPQADPALLTTFPAFLGKGKLNGGAWVWIAARVNPGSGAVGDTLLAIPNNQAFLTRKSVSMPVTSSSATATVYFPWEF